MSYIRQEPVRFWNAITVLVEAVIALLVIFGAIVWSVEQTAAVMGVVAAAGGVFQFFFVRNQVTPVE